MLQMKKLRLVSNFKFVLFCLHHFVFFVETTAFVVFRRGFYLLIMLNVIFFGRHKAKN